MIRGLGWLTIVVLAAAGCASSPTTGERGWIGGQFADVSRTMRTWEPGLPRIERDGTIVGMPDGVPGDAAALMTSAFDGVPIARAGLAPGDLVLSVDGESVDGALSLVERCESLRPGSTADVVYWRGGTTRTAHVVVGRETFESAGQIGVGLALSSELDFWPFDDGIDVLGLLRVRTDQDRSDVAGPEAAYLRQLAPDEPVVGRRQEAVDVWLLVAGVAKGKRVLRQESLP